MKQNHFFQKYSRSNWIRENIVEKWNHCSLIKHGTNEIGNKRPETRTGDSASSDRPNDAHC